MNNLLIDGFLSLFSLETISLVFKKYSGLDEGSYGIMSITYEDNLSAMFFDYPTDFTHGKALDLLNDINAKISKLTIEELLEELV